MNDVLLTKFLTGDAPDDDWQGLDERLSREPALARRWCEAARMDADLSRLLSPRCATPVVRWKRTALWTAATAASLLCGWFTLQFRSPRGDTAHFPVPASPSPRVAALPPEAPSSPPSSPKAEHPVKEAAGDVVSVDTANGFVLVKAREGITLSAGQVFKCEGSDGHIRISSERIKSLVAADIVDGTPLPGESFAAVEADAAPAANKKPISISRINTKEKVMALTFEDGPVAATTPRLLDILKREGVKATFFPTGANLDHAPEIARRMVAEGHELGNHTQTLPILSRVDETRFRKEIELCQEKIRAFTGKKPELFRPPYGALSEAQKELVSREYQCTTVLWSLDPTDWKTRDTARTINAVIQQAGEGRIVLLHDIYSSTVDAVPEIIRRLKADGWRFLTVTELMKLEG